MNDKLEGDMESSPAIENQVKVKKDSRVKEPGKNKIRQIKHARVIAGNVELLSGKDLMKIGYAPSYAKDVTKVKTSKSFVDLLDELMPDDDILEEHKGLMKSRKLDTMVFPTTIEDAEIAELLADVNCALRKVVHGTQVKHAYFWSPDNRARKDALDMLYKLKGKYAPEKVEDVTPYKHLSTAELLERKKAAIAFYKKQKPS